MSTTSSWRGDFRESSRETYSPIARAFWCRSYDKQGQPEVRSPRVIALTRAAQEAPALARRNPHQLYKLQRDFEIAGLNELITRFEAHLLNSRPEPFWQKLLKLNPFILSMLFGYPIVLVHDQAHVGGQRLDG